MHMGTHTYVLTWIGVHTHDLLKAAPSAYGRAKRERDDKARGCPRSWDDKACPVVIPCREGGYLSAGRHAQLDTYMGTDFSPGKHRLTVPLGTFRW